MEGHEAGCWAVAIALPKHRREAVLLYGMINTPQVSWHFFSLLWKRRISIRTRPIFFNVGIIIDVEHHILKPACARRLVILIYIHHSKLERGLYTSCHVQGEGNLKARGNAGVIKMT